MLITRYAKMIMSLSLALFCLLVAFDNITDYGTNYAAVQHVLSMDTTFPGNALMYRAITNPALWHLAYAVIIAVEVILGFLFLAGAVRLFQVRHASGAVFNQAKTLIPFWPSRRTLLCGCWPRILNSSARAWAACASCSATRRPARSWRPA